MNFTFLSIILVLVIFHKSNKCNEVCDYASKKITLKNLKFNDLLSNNNEELEVSSLSTYGNVQRVMFMHYMLTKKYMHSYNGNMSGKKGKFSKIKSAKQKRKDKVKTQKQMSRIVKQQRGRPIEQKMEEKKDLYSSITSPTNEKLADFKRKQKEKDLAIFKRKTKIKTGTDPNLLNELIFKQTKLKENEIVSFKNQFDTIEGMKINTIPMIGQKQKTKMLEPNQIKLLNIPNIKDSNKRNTRKLKTKKFVQKEINEKNKDKFIKLYSTKSKLQREEKKKKDLIYAALANKPRIKRYTVKTNQMKQLLEKNRLRLMEEMESLNTFKIDCKNKIYGIWNGKWFKQQSQTIVENEVLGNVIRWNYIDKETIKKLSMYNNPKQEMFSKENIEVDIYGKYSNMGNTFIICDPNWQLNDKEKISNKCAIYAIHNLIYLKKIKMDQIFVKKNFNEILKVDKNIKQNEYPQIFAKTKNCFFSLLKTIQHKFDSNKAWFEKLIEKHNVSGKTNLNGSVIEFVEHTIEIVDDVNGKVIDKYKNKKTIIKNVKIGTLCFYTKLLTLLENELIQQTSYIGFDLEKMFKHILFIITAYFYVVIAKNQQVLEQSLPTDISYLLLQNLDIKNNKDMMFVEKQQNNEESKIKEKESEERKKLEEKEIKEEEEKTSPSSNEKLELKKLTLDDSQLFAGMVKIKDTDKYFSEVVKPKQFVLNKIDLSQIRVRKIKKTIKSKQNEESEDEDESASESNESEEKRTIVVKQIDKDLSNFKFEEPKKRKKKRRSRLLEPQNVFRLRKKNEFVFERKEKKEEIKSSTNFNTTLSTSDSENYIRMRTYKKTKKKQLKKAISKSKNKKAVINEKETTKCTVLLELDLSGMKSFIFVEPDKHTLASVILAKYPKLNLRDVNVGIPKRITLKQLFEKKINYDKWHGLKITITPFGKGGASQFEDYGKELGNKRIISENDPYKQKKILIGNVISKDTIPLDVRGITKDDNHQLLDIIEKEQKKKEGPEMIYKYDDGQKLLCSREMLRKSTSSHVMWHPRINLLSNKRIEYNWQVGNKTILNYPYENKIRWKFNGNIEEKEINMTSDIMVFHYKNNGVPFHDHVINVKVPNKLAVQPPSVDAKFMAMFTTVNSLNVKKITQNITLVEPMINPDNLVAWVNKLKAHFYDPAAPKQNLSLSQLFLASEMDRIETMMLLASGNSTGKEILIGNTTVSPKTHKQNGERRSYMFGGNTFGSEQALEPIEWDRFCAMCEGGPAYAFSVNSSWSQEWIDMLGRYTQGFSKEMYQRSLSHDGYRLDTNVSKYKLVNTKNLYLFDRENLFVAPRGTDSMLHPSEISEFQLFLAKKYNLLGQLLEVRQMVALMMFQKPLSGPYKREYFPNNDLDYYREYESIDVLEIYDGFGIGLDETRPLYLDVWMEDYFYEYDSSLIAAMKMEYVEELDSAMDFVHGVCIAQETVLCVNSITKGKIAELFSNPVTTLQQAWPLTNGGNFYHFREKMKAITKINVINDTIQASWLAVQINKMCQEMNGWTFAMTILEKVNYYRSFQFSNTAGRYRLFNPATNTNDEQTRMCEYLSVPVTWHTCENWLLHNNVVDLNYIPRKDERIVGVAKKLSMFDGTVRSIRVPSHTDFGFGESKTKETHLSCNSVAMNIQKLYINLINIDDVISGNIMGVDSVSIKVHEYSSTFNVGFNTKDIKVLFPPDSKSFRKFYPSPGQFSTWQVATNHVHTYTVCLNSNVNRIVRGWNGTKSASIGRCGISVEPSYNLRITAKIKVVPTIWVNESTVKYGKLNYGMPGTNRIVKDPKLKLIGDNDKNTMNKEYPTNHDEENMPRVGGYRKKKPYEKMNKYEEEEKDDEKYETEEEKKMVENEETNVVVPNQKFTMASKIPNMGKVKMKNKIKDILKAPEYVRFQRKRAKEPISNNMIELKPKGMQPEIIATINKPQGPTMKYTKPKN